MFQKNKMHFEISERKILLRLFDALFIISVLYILDQLFNFQYFAFQDIHYYAVILLIVYVNIFGSIFEMYNLQVSSNQLQILRSVVLTTTTTVLFYLFTPVFSPELPNQRLAIV